MLEFFGVVFMKQHMVNGWIGNALAKNSEVQFWVLALFRCLEENLNLITLEIKKVLFGCISLTVNNILKNFYKGGQRMYIRM